MFSVVPVLRGGGEGGPHLIIPHDAIGPHHIGTCSNLFDLDLTVQAPAPCTEPLLAPVCTVGKRVVGILLECFLVGLVEVVVVV